MPNEYTRQWFDVFMETLPAERTSAEVKAIEDRLPRPDFTTILDICCGPGRHAAGLSERGYDVTGIDRDVDAVRQAAERVPNARFVALDQRSLGSVTGRFDAALILWQSFGYFDALENDAVLAAIARLLRPGGRLLLDLFHRGHFEQHQGRIAPTRDPRCVSITNTMHGTRLTSEIVYVDDSSETMDFELFTPDDIEHRASQFGLVPIESCCWWNRDRPPTPEAQRFQVMFERV